MPDATAAKPSLLRRLATLLALVALVWLLAQDRLWAMNVDAAHHFALATRLFEHGTMPPGSDDTLAEMNFYPRGAHTLAAAAGRLFGSPMLGMHVVGLASVVLLWAALGVLLKEQPDRELGVALLVLAVALYVAPWLGLYVHGYEVVGNYFLAQMAAQALQFSVLALWSRLRGWTAAPAVRFGLPCAASVLLVGFHLLPALVLLATTVVVLAVEAVRAGPSLWRNALWPAAAAVCIWLHPGFQAMRLIAVLNGDPAFVPSLVPLVFLCLAVLALATPGLRRAARGGVDLFGLVSAHAAAVSGLCLIQFVALQLGAGSTYACRKYGFGVGTLLVVLVSLLVGRVLPSGAGTGLFSRAGARLRPYTVVLVAAMGVLSVRPAAGTHDVWRFVQVDRVLREFRALHPPGIGESPDIAFGIEGLGRSGDYLVSIACLRHPRDEALMRLIFGRPPPPFLDERFRITSEAAASGFAPSLRLGTLEGGLVVLDVGGASCGKRRIPLVRSLQRVYPGKDILLDGFGDPEEFGRWTVAKSARYRVPIPRGQEATASAVRLVFALGYAPRQGAQRAGVSVNGGPLQTVVVGNARQAALLVYSPSKVPGVLDLRFEIPGACSPASAGEGEDSRQLGLALSTVELVTVTRTQ